MKIIATLEALDFEYEAAEELTALSEEQWAQIKQDVIAIIADEYNDRFHGEDAPYIESDTNGVDMHFGALEPELLAQEVNGWNNAIKARFIAAAEKSFGGKTIPDVEHIQMGGDDLYELACATRELDDIWYCNAKYATYVRYGDFSVCLTEPEKEVLLANLWNAVIITVTPCL